MAERDIFLNALERDEPADRAGYLDQACGADVTLRRRVDALLRSHATCFMEVPVVEQLSRDVEGLDFLAPSDRPGSLGRLDHYEILEVVGRGGMGIVFKAFDTTLHRVVALKALAPQLATSGAARQRFVREARAAGAVTHDHVIAIHSVADAGPVPYLVMQFVDGPTLQQKLDRTGLMSLKEVLRIGLQLAEGLAAAHRHGLIHRDIKPANILLENGIERIKITDFGLARAGDDDVAQTQSGMIAGTPMYMSPEQANAAPVDHRSDLFSLGSVMYAMCAGQAAFRGAGAMAVLKRVCEEAPRPIRELNPDVPQWLEELVARLQAKAPADRFASAKEVADVLARRLAELQRGAPGAHAGPPAASTPGPGTSGESPRRRPRRPGLKAAAVLLPLLAGLGAGEATGVTNFRGTVRGWFRPQGVSGPDDRRAAQGMPAASTLPVADADVAAWERGVAAMSPEDQVRAVAARLRELNPGFDGEVTPTYGDDVVYGLRFSTDQVTDVAPVRALARLATLDLTSENGRLVSLAPLRGMRLTLLKFAHTRVADLSPLAGMPLTHLVCGFTDVSDLGPLKDAPLRQLFCQCPGVSDLSPLRGMRLDALDVGGSAVTDLSPLRDMPITELGLFGAAQLTDLSPLARMPLSYLNVGLTAVADLSPIKGVATLRGLVITGTRVRSLSDLTGLPLTSLSLQGTNISDLAPLRGMPLKAIWFDERPGEADASLRSLTGLERINGVPAAEFRTSQDK